MDEHLAGRLVSAPDWSGFRLGDLSEGLRSLALLTLAGPINDETVAYWNGRCDAEIDFLVYSFALVDLAGAHEDSSKAFDQLVREWSPLPLTLTSRRNLLPVYLNTYFFKYIASVELPRLQVALTNPGLTPDQCIDFYITYLLYSDVVEENPGQFFTYEQIPGVSPSRVAALQQVRAELASSFAQFEPDRFASVVESLRNPFGRIADDDIEKLLPVFRCIFLLMTYYVGSNYRRVHDAVTTLLSIEMADFRSAFFETLPSIIQHRGGLLPQISVEATLAEAGISEASTQPKRLSTPAATAEKPSGGCYVATAVYGSYDCPEV